MKKTRKNAGFTLIEMLCALLIMVFLIMGMGVGMDAGSRIYRDATFEADSATLAGILNTSLGDILRYSTRIKEEKNAAGNCEIANIPEERRCYAEDEFFVFTSLDYGIQDAYFDMPVHEDGGYMGALKMKNLRNSNEVELVNSGAYPNLGVKDFAINYTRRVAPGIEGGYFEITYKIYSETDSNKVREVETIVRLMND